VSWCFGGVSVASWWCFGGLSVVPSWCLNGVGVPLVFFLVVPYLCVSGVLVVFLWCLGGVFVEFCGVSVMSWCLYGSQNWQSLWQF
jgi:hypothetical protein